MPESLPPLIPLRLTARARSAVATLLTTSAVFFGWISADVHANPFPNADHAVGQGLHSEMCVECHAQGFGGDHGSEIYTRLDRRVTTPSGLAQQLTACTTMLGLDLFPEDEHHIAGYLNEHYYRFE